MKNHSVSAVLFVKDLDKLATFYEQIAGMHRLQSDDVHLVLEVDLFHLVVHKLPEQIARDPEGNPVQVYQDKNQSAP